MENKSEYQISSSVNKDIIEVIITGHVTKSTFENLLNEADNILRASGAGKVIWDVRALEGRFAYVDVYSRARSYTRHYYDVHNAIVDLPGNASFASVYETIVVNAGVSLKCFTDMETARSWLKKK